MRMMVLLMELIVRHPTIDAEDDMVAAVEAEADSSLMTTATEVVPAKVESKRKKSDLRA